MKRDKQEKIFEVIALALYEENFPMEDYSTAEYINGRKDRCFKYYQTNSIFNAKVNKLQAYIQRIVED